MRPRNPLLDPRDNPFTLDPGDLSLIADALSRYSTKLHGAFNDRACELAAELARRASDGESIELP